jgi:hypothetical protein
LFDALIDPRGVSMRDARYTSGSVVGDIVLYEPAQYPFGCIGPAQFMWRQQPTAEADETQQQLWLWIHPAIEAQTLEALRHVGAIQVGHTNDTVDDIDTDNSNHTHVMSCSTATPTFQVLTGQLLRFRLTGPRSHALLQSTLDVVDAPNGTRAYAVWKRLRSLRSTASLVSGCVLALSVLDPRYSFPPPAAKHALATAASASPHEQRELNHIVSRWCKQVAVSSIWSAEARQAMSNQQRKCDIDRQRSTLPSMMNVVDTPDSCAQSTDRLEPMRISIVLVQQPGEQGLGAGWDVIVPHSWGKQFWQSLVHAGARVIGLREQHLIARESARPFFPTDFPDCHAYRLEAVRQAHQAVQTFYAKPPSKRINYDKLNIPSPFYEQWERIIGCTTPHGDASYRMAVLRNKFAIQDALTTIDTALRNSMSVGSALVVWVA